MKELDYGRAIATRTTRRMASRPGWSACRRPTRAGRFYQPVERGMEIEIKRKLDSIRKKPDESNSQELLTDCEPRLVDYLTLRSISGRSGRMNEKR